MEASEQGSGKEWGRRGRVGGRGETKVSEQGNGGVEEGVWQNVGREDGWRGWAGLVGIVVGERGWRTEREAGFISED